MTRRGRPPKTSREEIIAATLDVLRERGLARLTTREIASRMGISEGSIFYHFGDRQGLLEAVFSATLHPVLEFKTAPLQAPPTVAELRNGLLAITDNVGAFLDAGLDVLLASQADAELRDDLFAVMAENDHGPHHSITTIANFIRAAQDSGLVDHRADADALAYLLIGSVFLRCTQPRLTGHEKGRVDNEAVVDTVMYALGARADAQS